MNWGNPGNNKSAGMKTIKFAQSYEIVADMPPHLQSLMRLATNFRWCWHPETQNLFHDVDPGMWEEVEHNPVKLIRALSPERIERLELDAVFQSKLALCEKSLDEYLVARTWFDETYPGKRDELCFAYFCAEFGLNESLPIYSGGLGLLAGDHLKAASDLGLPLVGVGLLYSRGYFRQRLSDDGWQQENYPQTDFYSLPLTQVRNADDTPLQVLVDLPDRSINIQVWKAKLGRIELFLLDSNLITNAPQDQSITDNLYGGDENMRIRQEMVLGIGGLRALKAMGIKPDVCHMNEGHAAFLTLERLRQYQKDMGCDLKTARQVTVAGNVFTTHTPVPAGFDVFSPEMLKNYVSEAVEQAGIAFDDFLTMGRMKPTTTDEPFNMAILAMSMANHVNGVSRLHADVSRGMFQDRWPDFPIEEVPIDAITNGVHTMTWIGHRMVELLDRHLGVTWRDKPSHPDVWRAVHEMPDADLWEIREDQRADLVRFCRKRLMKSAAKHSHGRGAILEAGAVLDPRILTIGFARRFATYKRASLLFTDAERLKAILLNSERPVQFVFAGKSHPRDDGGKGLIQEIVRFIKRENLQSRLIFIEDYDIEVARHLVQGVDVWLNNPRRPLEASGTSGMKVVPNGGLNCSILDGWWAEGYQSGMGWAIGDDVVNPDQAAQDWFDSKSLYQLIEQEIAPTFYNRNELGLPLGWIQMMRRSMATLAPRFSTSRMVREYTQRFYMPAATQYRNLDADNQANAKEVLAWRSRVRKSWPDVKILSVTRNAGASNKVGEEFAVQAHVQLGGLQPEDVQVQLVIGNIGPNRELVDYVPETMRHAGPDGNAQVFELTVGCTRPGHRGFVCRVIPKHDNVNVASEIPLVVWQQTD